MCNLTCTLSPSAAAMSCVVPRVSLRSSSPLHTAFRVFGKVQRRWQLRSPHRALQAQCTKALLESDGSYSADPSSVLDGPDIFIMRTANNLGAIQDSLKGHPSDADIKAMQDVPHRGTAFEGIYIDAPAIFGSTVLLSVLLYLSLERVLGLDELLPKAKEKWKERQTDKEKWAVYNARQRLEDTFSSTDEAADDKR